MGRKTWESIPPKFRPLQGRINVVVSRKPHELDLPHEESAVLGVGSIEEGLRRLQSIYPAQAEGSGQGAVELGRVFVIGGAEIYDLALRMPCCERVLWTRLRGEWECDTFFPKGVLRLDGGGDGGKWGRRSAEEMEEWVGEEGVGGVKREGGVEFEMVMLERER